MKLSILIPSLENRKAQLAVLKLELYSQCQKIGEENSIKILTEIDNGETPTGKKRNILLQRAIGKYVAFFDDDDFPTPDYMPTLFEGIKKDRDCISLRGIYTVDGENPEIFEHSIRYKAWRTTTNEVKYERYPNHLNCIKTEIAQQVIFPEIYHGEDKSWSDKLFESKLIKTEYYTDEIIYLYRHKTK